MTLLFWLCLVSIRKFFFRVVPGEYENEQNEVAREGQRYELYY